ncbi:MAG: stage III sporulation protein AF [Clostridiales bacterium]|nr:stage III sporulation protein AF [Clostridiales bacterium]
MIEKISEMVKNLTMIIIIISSLINLISGREYEKYVRYIVGMLIAIYILNGFMSVIKSEGLNEEFSISDKYYDKCIKDADEIFSKTYEETLSKEITREIGNGLKNAGYSVSSLSCYYQEGEGYFLKFTASSQENVNVIKNYIRDFYQFDVTHIYGYTEDKRGGVK